MKLSLGCFYQNRTRPAFLRTGSSAVAILFAALLIFSGCDTTPPGSSSSEAPNPSETAGIVVSSETGPQPVDEEADFDAPPSLDLLFFHIAEQVPGFGGFFFGEDGQLTTYLLPEAELDRRGYDEVLSDEERVERLRAVIDLYFPDEDFYGRGSDDRADVSVSDAIRVVPAEYEARELLSWRWQLREEAPERLVSLDFDESQNRIAIGMQGGEDEMLALLGALDIPVDAVVIREEEPVQMGATIRDRVRNIHGGTQISRLVGDNGISYCTLGFPARMSGQEGFFTNAHCSDEVGSTTAGSSYRQGGGTVVAEERVDPPLFSQWSKTYTVKKCFRWGWPCRSSSTTYRFNTHCAKGQDCRYSDALFAVRTSSTDHVAFGRIARVTGIGTTGTGQAGSLDINSLDPAYRITGTKQYAIHGEVLDKIGRSTGHTYGKVRRTSYDSNQIGTGRTMLDQQGVGCYRSEQNTFCAMQAGGDSGSPVFDWSSNGDIELHGILWGGTNKRFVYSPLGGLSKDGMSPRVF